MLIRQSIILLVNADIKGRVSTVSSINGCMVIPKRQVVSDRSERSYAQGLLNGDICRTMVSEMVGVVP